MSANTLAKRILRRIHDASLPPGTSDARERLETNLKRLALSIGDNEPDSPAGWMAIVEYGQDSASVEARLAVARETNPPSYQGYLRVLELFELARQRRAQGVKPYGQ